MVFSNSFTTSCPKLARMGTKHLRLALNVVLFPKMNILSTTLVQSVCENGLLLVCYVPHWEAPYEDLVSRIEAGEAEVRLESFSSSSASSESSACHLKKELRFEERNQDFTQPAGATAPELWGPMLLKLSAYDPPTRNVTLNTPYCTQIDFFNDLDTDCGIRIYNMGVSWDRLGFICFCLLVPFLPTKTLELVFDYIFNKIPIYSN